MAEKSPREGVLPVCRHHQRGFCKHADKCHKHHVNEICSTIPCKDLNCTKRHPKKCKYFEENNFCKFNTKCAYSHEKPEISVEMKYALEEIQKLKHVIKVLKNNINHHTQPRHEKSSGLLCNLYTTKVFTTFEHFSIESYLAQKSAKHFFTTFFSSIWKWSKVPITI